jgi:hypothetical protein
MASRTSPPSLSNLGTALTLFLPILNKEEEDYTVVPDPMGFCYRLCSRVRESKEPIKQVIAEFVSQTHAEYICDALNQERLPGRYSGGNV